MRRREFISLLASTVACPLAARAQQTSMPVIGFLGGVSPKPFASRLAAFRQGLNETGFVRVGTWRSNTAGRRTNMIDYRRSPPIWPVAQSWR